MRRSHEVLSVCLSLLVASPVLAQPGGERGGPPAWGGAFDPSRIFESMDVNRDGIVTRDEQRGRRDQERFDDYVRRAGVSDGRLTRELFLQAFQQRMNERMSGRAFVNFGNSTNPQDLFRNYDRNSDGRLDTLEIQRTMPRTQVERFDANRDNAIDREEFAQFVQLAAPGNSPAGPSAAGSPESKPDAEKPPEVRPHYRAGKLPPNIQDWFKELDRDHDGQVGLYEWKGRPAEEFAQLDRDGDGFITIAEAEHAAAKPPAKPDNGANAHQVRFAPRDGE
jgi:Ca2+-binding EF-hand superfamily protein